MSKIEKDILKVRKFYKIPQEYEFIYKNTQDMVFRFGNKVIEVRY